MTDTNNQHPQPQDHTTHDPAPHDPTGETIADQNLRRLLERAYQPEPVEPAFAKGVEALMQGAAMERRDAGILPASDAAVPAASPAGVSPAVGGISTPTAARPGWPRHARAGRPRHMLAAAAVVVAAITVAGIIMLMSSPGRPQPNGGRLLDLLNPPPIAAQNDYQPLKSSFMQPRPAAPAAAPQKVAVGDLVQTAHGQTHRLAMPDGSVLYVNQDTRLAICSSRSIDVQAGEVFVEVAPAASEQDRFIVKTPDREVTALGTKFDVKVSPDKTTDVLVTQGKVRVSGLADLLYAGRQLSGRTAAVSAASAGRELAWTQPLMEESASPLVPASQYGGGAIVVDVDGQQTRLSLRKFHVDVYVEDGFARTTIDQTYFNHEDRRLEGTFYFPLPPDASLSRLAMYVNGKLMEGGMAERDYARGVYESIVRRMQDPALLEWIDGSTFKMRVFPLEARQEKRIILSYTQKLPVDGGRMNYRFPAGHSLAATGQWSFHARLKGGAGLAWSSDSHNFTERQAQGDLLLDTSEKDSRLDRDVVLTIQDTGAPAARFSHAQHEGAQYLMLRYRPDLPAGPQPQRRDWVFLFEASGDRDPLLARTQIEVVRGLLGNAERDDHFSIVVAGTDVQMYQPAPLPATRENIDAAMDFLSHVHLLGALDLEQGLAAASQLLKGSSNGHLVHVGSGVPVLGVRDQSALLASLPSGGVRYIGIGVGKRWDRNFMRVAAARTGGAFTQINPDQNIPWLCFDLVQTLNSPRLINIKVTGKWHARTGREALQDSTSASLASNQPAGATSPAHGQDARATSVARATSGATPAEFLCFEDSVSAGQELTAIARIEAGALLPTNVTVTGTLDGQEFSETIPVTEVQVPVTPISDLRTPNLPAGQAGSPLPRMHAKLQIDKWLAQDSAANKDKIVKLSKEMYVMSPYTSLLVLENEDMYKQYNVDRGRKDHWAMYDCPEAIPVVTDPLPGVPAVAPSSTNSTPTTGPAAEAQRLRQKYSEALGSVLVRTPPQLVYVPNSYYGYYGGGRTFTAWDFASGAVWQGLNAPRITLFNGQRGYAYLNTGALTNINTTAWVPDHGTLLIGGQLSGYQWIDYNGRYSRIYPSNVPLLSRIPVVNDLFDNRNPTRDEGDLQLLLTKAPIIIQDCQFMDDVQVDFLLRATGQDAYLLGPTDPFTGSIVRDYGISSGWGAWRDYRDDKDFDRRLDGRYWIDGLQGITKYDPSALRLPDPTRGGRMSFEARHYLQFHMEASQKGQWGKDDLVWSRSGGDEKVSRDRLYADIAGATWAGDPQLGPVRPLATNDWRVFTDLISYCPGFDTTQADVLAVLDQQELIGPASTGRIDAGARKLIDACRSQGWKTLTWHGHPAHDARTDNTSASLASNQPAGAASPSHGPDGRATSNDKRGQDGRDTRGQDARVTFDGSGRYVFERELPMGLAERVVCDGASLYHLYGDLGVGTRRANSRFHQAQFIGAMPYLLPPAEQLASNADVVLVDDHTIALVPLVKQPATAPATQPARSYVKLLLIFADDGRLVERRVVLAESGKTIYRETYDKDGKVTIFGSDGKEVASLDYQLADAASPDLSVSSDLVVVPMPCRTEAFIFAEMAKANRAKTQPTPDEALALTLSYVRTGSLYVAMQTVMDNFLSKGDTRIGLYTLLVSSNSHWDPESTQGIPGGSSRLDPTSISSSPLASYIKQAAGIGNGDNVWKPMTQIDGVYHSKFLGRLYDFRNAWCALNQVRNGNAKFEDAWPRALNFVTSYDASPYGLAILCDLGSFSGGQAFSAAVSRAWEKYENYGGPSYLARYESARCASQSGNNSLAMIKFESLYNDALAEGFLPPIDREFTYSFSNTGNIGRMSTLIRKAADEAAKNGQRVSLLTLAWQCANIGRTELADEVLTKALTNVPQKQRTYINLAAVKLLCRTSQWAKADSLLRPLLAQKELADISWLWRLGSYTAQQQGRTAQSVRDMERAMDLDYGDPKLTMDVRAVRDDLGQLMQRYTQLAQAMATLEQPPPGALLEGIIRTADRWRALDDDPTAACQAAAAALEAAGKHELAWAYITTPLAAKPNEAAPWSALAQTLRRQNQGELAVKAYDAAFAIEPGNAQILMDQAGLLAQLGRHDQARQLYRQIADKDWGSSYTNVRQQARQLLGEK